MRHLTLVFWAVSILLFSLGVDASPSRPVHRKRGSRCRPSTILSSLSETSTSTTVETVSSSSSAAPEISVTTSAEPSSDSTSVPGIPDLSTIWTETAGSITSSTTDSPATTSTTAPAPDQNLVLDGGFEGTASAWNLVWQADLTQFTYNFNDTRVSHSGTASGSVTWAPGIYMASFMFWINQPISLVPNARYAFSAWTSATANSNVLGCHLAYAIFSPNSSQTYTPALASPTLITTAWTQTTSTWVNTGGHTTASFNIRAVCSAMTAPAAGYSIFFDDISFQPV